MERRKSQIRPGIIHLAVLLGYALLTLVMTWPLAANLRSAIPGDGFDGWQNYWNLWWLKTALVERLALPYFTDLLYYPTGVGLYFHTLNPLNGLMTLPIQLADGLMVAYNAVVLISWALAGYGVFLLCLWLVAEDVPNQRGERSDLRAGKRLAAFVAGLIYAFAPVHMAHLLGHMQVMSLQWLPFYILFLLRAIRAGRAARPWRRDALLAGLFLIFNGLSDWYFVLYLFLFTALAVVYFGVGAVAHPHGVKQALAALWRVVAPPLVAGLVFAAVLSPILLPMVQDALHYNFMVRPASDLYVLSASLADFLIPNRLHSLWRPQSFTWPGNQIAPLSERTLALGYVASALAGVALLRRSRQAAFWGIAAFFFLLLALGPALHAGNIMQADVPVDLLLGDNVPGWTPFAALNRWVPFMRISRSVSRYALMVQLCVALLAGMGLHVLTRRLRPAAGIGVAGLAAALVLGESWVAPYPLSPPDTPAFYAQLAAEPGVGAVLNLPMNYDRPGYLLYQTVHRRPLTVAYISRDDPRTLTERVSLLQRLRRLGPDILADTPARVGVTTLGDLGVEYVILDRYKMPGGDERTVTEAIAAEVFAGQTPLYADERLTVYRVPPAAPQPYVVLDAQNWGPLMQRGEGLARDVNNGVACFAIQHPAAQMQVALHYGTGPGVEAELVAADGAARVALPPAPRGGRVELDIRNEAQANRPLEACVYVAHAGAVWVEEIAIQPDESAHDGALPRD